ncbi:MAG TPA: signal peptidase II [Phenylobacterium sp.]|nr:signal peptidase II [Phenylobacterium sp.]
MSLVSKAGGAALALAAAVVVLDQAVKHWILDTLHLPELASVPVVGPLKLTMVWNEGVSFGLFQAGHDVVRWGLAAFSIVVALVLAGWVRRTERALFALAIGLVMGGAVGNVIDRIRFGAVVDFVDVTALRFPWVFNVADSAISVGIGVLLLDMLLQDRREKAERSVGDAA